MKKSLINLYLFSTIIFLYSCKETHEAESITLIPEDFSFDNFSDEFIKDNLEIDWSSYNHVLVDTEEFLIYDAHLDAFQEVEKEGYSNSFKYFIVKSIKDKHYYLLQSLTSQDSPTTDPLCGQYIGISRLFDMDGKVKFFLMYDENLILVAVGTTNVDRGSARESSCMVTVEVAIYTTHYKDWYQWDYSTNNWEYVWTESLGTTVSYDYIIGPCNNIIDDQTYITQRSNHLIKKGKTIGDVWEQNPFKLCSNTLNFILTGDGFTASIDGLGASIYHDWSRKVVNAEFGRSCVQLNPYQIGTVYDAAITFAQIYNAARDQLALWVRHPAQNRLITSSELRNKLKELIINEINLIFGGTFSTDTGCSGNVPVSSAGYDTDC